MTKSNAQRLTSEASCYEPDESDADPSRERVHPGGDEVEESVASLLTEASVAKAIALNVSLPVDRVEVVVGRISGRSPFQIAYKGRGRRYG